MEERIYEVFLKNVPFDRQEEFSELYRELHGGAAAFADGNVSDDYGDEATAATDIAVQEVNHGALDYMWDFDYFSFQAEEAEVYLRSVIHETLSPSSINIYALDGKTKLGWVPPRQGF